MLYLNTGLAPRTVLQPAHHGASGGEGIWFDLLEPTDQERSVVERITNLRVPAQADIAEIESSSRLMTENGTLYLSMPLAYFDRETAAAAISPVGFVLSPHHLITVRYAAMPVFEIFSQRFAAAGKTTSGGAFIMLLEAIIDRLADVLEHVGADLSTISHGIFGNERNSERNATVIDQQLRATLGRIGRRGDRLANLRDSLVGIQRIVNYVHDTSQTWMDPALVHRCSALRADIGSLMEYDSQLSNKVQFLLDATLGFIKIEQNNGITILTVVSVVGVPPTLVASIYGMNFKWIPELEWHYGYFYGLTVIVLSGVVPYLWFKRRGWI